MTGRADWGSVEHQKEVAKLIGYDFTKWNPNDSNQVDELTKKALNAMLNGLLSNDDYELLSVITGRS